MKIRQGFVSNSSSSSFCILGINTRKVDVDVYKAHEAGLDYASGIYDYYDEQFIGLSPGDIGEDETIGQAKQRIMDSIAKLGGSCELEDIMWYVDGGYDG